MTQEDKQLLLKDLYARAPYGVMCWVPNGSGAVCKLRGIVNDTCYFDDNPRYGYSYSVEWLKPYLRPMSSMTEDEREEIEVLIFNEWYQEDSCKIDKEGWIEILANYDVSGIDPCFCSDYVDWLNAHYFDYRGLIERGLAIEVTEQNNPYKN